MIKITHGPSSLTIKNEKNNTSMTIRRNAATRDIEIHHNIEGKDAKPAQEIRKVVRSIMNANSRSSYEQRFKKVAKILSDVGTQATFKVLSNRLAEMQTEAAAA